MSLCAFAMVNAADIAMQITVWMSPVKTPRMLECADIKLLPASNCCMHSRQEDESTRHLTPVGLYPIQGAGMLEGADVKLLTISLSCILAACSLAQFAVLREEESFGALQVSMCGKAAL